MAVLAATPPTAAAPASVPQAAPPVPTGTPLPPSTIDGSGQGQTGGKSLRLRIAHWMEDRFGRAAMPVAALAGGVVGGGAGLMLLGPVGGLVGAAGGAFMGALLVTAG